MARSIYFFYADNVIEPADMTNAKQSIRLNSVQDIGVALWIRAHNCEADAGEAEFLLKGCV